MKIVNNSTGIVRIGSSNIMPGENSLPEFDRADLSHPDIVSKQKERNAKGEFLLVIKEADGSDVKDGTLPPPGGGENGSPDAKAAAAAKAKEEEEAELKKAAELKKKAEEKKK